MRKKYHTLEEVRRAAAERQRRWREENKVLARERVAYTYGRAKYPEMVEAARRKEAKPALGVINNPLVRYEEADEDELVRVSIDEIEGDKGVMEAHAGEMGRWKKKKPPPGVVVRKDPEERVVEEQMPAGDSKERRARFEELKKALGKKEPEVEIEME